MGGSGGNTMNRKQGLIVVGALAASLAIGDYLVSKLHERRAQQSIERTEQLIERTKQSIERQLDYYKEISQFKRRPEKVTRDGFDTFMYHDLDSDGSWDIREFYGPMQGAYEAQVTQDALYLRRIKVVDKIDDIAEE